MKIQSMFQKDIERDINGVIRCRRMTSRSLKDELSEYIITKELRRHFATFFDNYVKAIDTPRQIKSACGFPVSLGVVNLIS